MQPDRKVTVGIGIGGAVAIFSNWIATAWFGMPAMPEPVLIAWGVICSQGVSYLTRNPE
jgi:hypothetical protein